MHPICNGETESRKGQVTGSPMTWGGYHLEYRAPEHPMWHLTSISDVLRHIMVWNQGQPQGLETNNVAIGSALRNTHVE